MTAPGAGDLECSSENHMPVPGAGGAGGEEGGWHPAQASSCYRKAEGEEAGTHGPERSPGTSWPEWRERVQVGGSPGPRADPTLPTYSSARKTNSGLQEVTASSSLSSPDFSPCNSHLFPPLSLVSLFLCVCSLFLLISGSGILLSPVSDYLDFSLHLFILHSSFQVPLSALASRLLSADPCHL